MTTIIDNAGNIIIVAENQNEERLLQNIPDVKIMFQGPQRNPRTNRTDYILALKPEKREAETIVIEKIGQIPETKENTNQTEQLQNTFSDLHKSLLELADEIRTDQNEKRKIERLLNKNIEFQIDILRQKNESKQKKNSDSIDNP